MRFDLHVRQGVRDQVGSLAVQMASWEARAPLSDEAREWILQAITPFAHTTVAAGLHVAGVDGSGDYPALTYADSFVYLTVAASALYASDSLSGLREVAPVPAPLVEFTWLSTDEWQREQALLAAFGRLGGLPVDEVLGQSDYRMLKAAGMTQSVEALRAGLILPPAHDAGNLGIQLRTSAELGAALRLIETVPPGTLVLTDGTLTLPFASRERQSLFPEHLRRLCCVRARDRGVVFVALSKSHGLRGEEQLEALAREKMGGGAGVPEHWYLRVGGEPFDNPVVAYLDPGGRLPPAGAVTYFVRLHRTTPLFRLDLDQFFWEQHIRGASDEETRCNEEALLGRLDYASHDQRAYGYPYPIKAAHDRASLTDQERAALRKQIMDAAVQAGMRRSLFRSVALATGHA